jgi:DNA-binding transcriptional ArsR family regulator
MGVEGYWSSKTFTLSIQNKNLPFLRHIESIVSNLKMPIHKRILLKIKPKDNFDREEVRLLNKGKMLKFHIEKSPFDGSKKIVTSLPYKTNYDLNLIINKASFPININVGKEEISVKSELKGWAYLDLRFPNKIMLLFLDNYTIKRHNFLRNASGDYVAAAFSALIDSEGTIDHYAFFRKIRVRMRNKKYLEEWKELLFKHNIKARFRQNNDKEFEICIEGWEDFDRLNKLGLNLYHSKRKRKFEHILNSYKRKQISRDTAPIFYIKKLKEIMRPISASEFALKVGKGKRVINHYLKKLNKKGLVDIDKSKVTWLYSIK